MGIQERRGREREARRQSVLDAARALVRERGFNATTTRQIAERCELSEATLFFYFRSKDEIFTSLLFEGIEFMEKGLAEILADDLPVGRALDRLWGFFAGMREQHPEYFHVFTYLAHPQSSLAVDEEVRAEIARRSGDNFRRLADLLRGAVGPKRARVAADLVWAAFVGLVVLRDSRANMGAPAHPTPEDLGAAFRLLLAGVAPENGSRR